MMPWAKRGVIRLIWFQTGGIRPLLAEPRVRLLKFALSLIPDKAW